MKKIKIIFSALFIILICFGAYYIYSGWKSKLEKIYQSLETNAKIAQTALPKKIFDKLDFNQSDLEKPEYQHVKASLQEMIRVMKDVRFAYIYLEKEGKIYLVADSEDPASPDYSPPGQEYTEADWQMKKPLENGEFLITKPITDRWGTWISALAPIRDLDSEKVVAVFGIDYSAEKLKKELLISIIGRCGMIFGISLIIFVSYLFVSSSKKAKEALKKFDKIFEKNPTIMAISSLKNGKMTDVNRAFLEKLGFSEEEVIGKKSSELGIFTDLEKQKKLAKELKVKGSIKNAELQIRTNSGEILEGIFYGEIIEADGEKYFLTVMIDQTEKKKAEKELEKRFEETENINRLMVGREMKMIELKERIKNLENKTDEKI